MPCLTTRKQAESGLREYFLLQYVNSSVGIGNPDDVSEYRDCILMQA